MEVSNISDDGAIALAANTTLKSLKFNGISIRKAGYMALAANTTLRSIEGCELKDDTESLEAFFNNKTLIHCNAWLHLELATNFKLKSKDLTSRNKEALIDMLAFQVFSSMLNTRKTNQLPFDLIWYVGSFLIADSNVLKPIPESAKLRVLRTNSLASGAGMFSIKQLKSTSRIANDNETASEYDALLYS